MKIQDVQEFIFNKRKEFFKSRIDPGKLIFIFSYKDFTNLRYNTEFVHNSNMDGSCTVIPFGHLISWSPVVAEGEILTAIK